MTEEVMNEGNELAVVGESEGVSTETYQEDLDEVMRLREEADTCFYAFSEKLADVYNRSLYLNWGYGTWREFVTDKLDFGIRKTEQLLRVQRWLSKMTPEIREFIKKMGFTKARLLEHVITVDNFDKWKNMVEGKTVVEIEALLEADKNGDDLGGEGGGEGSGGEGFGREPERRQRFSFSCVGDQIPICAGAIERAMELAETDNQNQAFSMICLEFQGANTTNLSVYDYLRGVEKALGLDIIAMKKQEDGKRDVVFGEEYIPEEDDEDEPKEESAE